MDGEPKENKCGKTNVSKEEREFNEKVSDEVENEWAETSKQASQGHHQQSSSLSHKQMRIAKTQSGGMMEECGEATPTKEGAKKRPRE